MRRKSSLLTLKEAFHPKRLFLGFQELRALKS